MTSPASPSLSPFLEDESRWGCAWGGLQFCLGEGKGLLSGSWKIPEWSSVTTLGKV